MKDNSLLKVSHLEAGYGAIQVLWDINLEVKQKEIVCVIGANGAGKSTLLKNIVGIIPSFKGEIFYSGNNITKIASPQRIKMGFGFAPEGRHLFFGLTVEDNLLMGAFQRKNNKSLKEDLALVYSLFEVLKDYRKKYAGNLSGGEQQRVAVARALINAPSVILADEPSGNLDSVNAKELHKLFFSLRDRFNQTFIIVTHNDKFADMADRKLLIKDGLIID